MRSCSDRSMRLVEGALFLLAWVAGRAMGVGEDCAVLQLRAPQAPCYLYVGPREKAGLDYDFVYGPLLPGPTAAAPCPLLQTADPKGACYTRGGPVGTTRDVPAFYLTVPLPRLADDEYVLVEKLKRDKALKESGQGPPPVQTFPSPAPQAFNAPAAPTFVTPFPQAFDAPGSQAFATPSAQVYTAPAAQAFSAPVAQTYAAPAVQVTPAFPAFAPPPKPRLPFFPAPAARPAAVYGIPPGV